MAAETCTETLAFNNGDHKADSAKRDAYYLDSSDNPGLILTTCQLKENNHSELVKAMRLELRAKKKLGFVDG